jgi:hypothetical protein
VSDMQTQLRETLSHHASHAIAPEDLPQRARRRSRQLGRRRIAVVCGAAVAAVAATAGGRPAQTVTVRVAASPSATPAASPGSAKFGFDPSGPAPSCAKGQLPGISSDLSTVVSHGTWNDMSAQSWTAPYVGSLGIHGGGYVVGLTALVNGSAVGRAHPAVWVLGSVDGAAFTSSVVLTQTSDSTWEAHPAKFTGCQPDSK